VILHFAPPVPVLLVIQFASEAETGFSMKLLVLHVFKDFFSRTTWVSRYQRGKTSLDLNEARDDKILGCSVISWTISKPSALCSRQTTTPTLCHSIFTSRMLFLMPVTG